MQSRFCVARRMAAVAVAAALLGLVAGCGEGELTRLSRAGLDRRAQSVCAAGQADADRLRRETVPGARGEDAAREIDATRGVLESQIQAFAGLRGPASTDADLARLVRHLRAAAAGLATLGGVAATRDLTVDETIRARGDVVEQVNRSSAQASDDLVALGWLDCIGVTGG